MSSTTSDRLPPIERRSFGPLDVRQSPSGRPIVTGTACVFEVPYALRDNLEEEIAREAFGAGDFSSGRNIRLLVAHQDRDLLATLRGGTLKLSLDDRGLRFEGEVPETQLGADVVTMVKRGDLSGASIGFVVREQSMRRLSEKLVRRRVDKLELFEVSLVANPAADGTSVSLELRQEVDAIFSVDRQWAELAALARQPYERALARWRQSTSD